MKGNEQLHLARKRVCHFANTHVGSIAMVRPKGEAQEAELWPFTALRVSVILKLTTDVEKFPALVRHPPNLSRGPTHVVVRPRRRFLRPARELTMLRSLGLTALLTCLGALRCPAAEKKPTPEQARWFESKIRPLLADRCVKCHGPKKQKGELRLDSRAALLEGGDQGPAAVPGAPEKSLLITAVQYTRDDLQ